MLIAAGANTDAIDKIPRNPLTHAIFREISSDTSVIESIVTLLVSAGAKLNVTEVEICNPLIACSHARSAKLMKFFLASGADPNLNCKIGPIFCMCVHICTLMQQIYIALIKQWH